MFKWIRNLFGKKSYTWYVEGWESEHDLDGGDGHMTGPFETELQALKYANQHFDEGLWNVDLMWRP